jgi:hypothetical protein
LQEENGCTVHHGERPCGMRDACLWEIQEYAPHILHAAAF